MAPKRGKFAKIFHRRRKAASPRRAFVTGVASVLFVAGLAAAVIHPVPANAQFGGVVSDVGAGVQRVVRNIIDAGRYIADKTASIAKDLYKKSGDLAFKNALRVFLGKIAEDTATWVASGGKGQGPLFITDPNYFKDLGNAAAGDFLDTLSKEQFGVSICDPGIAKLNIDIALRVNLNPNFCQENCQKNNADQLKQTIVVGPANDSVSTSRNGAGPLTASEARGYLVILQSYKAEGRNFNQESVYYYCKSSWASLDKCIEYYETAASAAELAASANLKLCLQKCANAKTRRTTSCTLTAIGNNVQNSISQSSISLNTPLLSGRATGASLQQAFEKGDLPAIFKPSENPLGQFLTFYNEAQEQKVEAEKKEKDLQLFGGALPIKSLISGAIKTPAFLTQKTTEEGLSTQNAGKSETTQTGSPIADAFGIFTNTLTNKLIERIFSKGLVDPKAKSLTFGGGTISSTTGGVAAAKERFASLGQVNLGAGGGIDILNDLNACPVDVTNVSETTLGLVSQNNCVIDSSFRQAVEEHLTVRQALDRKLLSDQKVFGFDANGREPDFRSGYPFRSLKILRKYRIIPVGWELAAQYIRDFERQNVNLGAIMQQFDNPDSPYYRLIDPNWVLKAPENICLRTGFSSDVVSQEYVDEDGDEGGRKNINYADRYCNNDSDANIGKKCTCTTNPVDPSEPCVSEYATDPPGEGLCVKSSATSDEKATCAYITPRQEQIQRREACVDERTCVLENDDGTCKQFGTCTEEKDTWRFNGQSCSNVYASCQTYTDSGGQSVSYLKNTLQPNSCGADNAGCQQYCTSYDYNTGKWSCTDTTPTTQTKRFDRDVQECDANVEGCTQFLRMTTGTNLVGNGGFEQSTVVNPANNANFSGWTTGDGTHTCGAQTFVSTQALGGSQAARLQYVPVCTTGGAQQQFSTTIRTGTPIEGRTFTTSFYARSEGASCSPETQLGAGGWLGAAPSLTITPDWQRYSYTTTVGSTGSETSFTLIFKPTDTCTYLLDNVQVEEGGQLTDYKDYGAVNQVHLKRPADALLCTGNVATDPPACSKFISKCTAADVGCDLFTPTAGGAAVPAKGGISCPADKVGCATFREQPTTGVLKAHDTRTGKYCKSQLVNRFTSCTDDSQCGGVAGDCQPLVSFIAKTGTQCTAQDVGCEAYTNLDQVAQGGEGKVQFTKLQLCVQPDDPGLKNYYSWVGDNETGYQLKQYRLKQSNVSSGPCTNLATNQTLPLACEDDIRPVIDCQATFGTDPDCGQYYDEDGQPYYRLRSRLIEGTADCHPYRNTVDSNVYYADATKSLSCSAAAVGCREYVGNTGSNTRTVLKSEFENGSSSPWVVSGNPANPSNESITFGGHSLHVTTMAQASGQPMVQGKTYTLSFWAKGAGSGPVDMEARLQNSSTALSMGTVRLSTDWNAYTLGPTKVDFDTSGTNILSILVADAYIDNLTLTEISDSTYRVKASQTACGGYEGCQEYRNRTNAVNTYTGFAKLCKSEVVGCEALINTQNSTSPFTSRTTFPSQRGDVDGSGKVDSADVDYLIGYLGGGPAPFPLEAGDVNASGSVNITDVTALVNFVSKGTPLSSNPYDADAIDTASDVVEFWVNDPTKSCRAEEKGCRALGKQTFDASGKLQNMETVYLRDNPDVYATIMCGLGALFCEEFTLPDGGKSYFRNPGSKVCSYRDASGNKSAGWYITGTDTPCPTRTLNDIPPAVPNGGYAGLCPAEQSGCGNFLDPVGTGASLTTNGNFEVENGSAPKGWTSGYCASRPSTLCHVDADCGSGTCTQSGSVIAYTSNNGSQAVRAVITGQGTFTQTINLDANGYYVVSADVAKGSAAMTEDFRLGLVSCKNAQGGDAPVNSPDGSLFNDNTSTMLRIPADRFSDTASLRVSGRFFSGNAVTCKVIAGAASGTAGYWLDNLQVHSTTNTPVIRQSVDATSCNGQVGDKQGCRLFNDLSNTSLAYDADQSPIGGSPTNPDASGSPAACAEYSELCDSNVLLKVQRDRQCSQWLTPTTTIESTKPNGQKENLTLGVATCDSFSPSGQCNHFVDELRCSNNPKLTCVDDTDCGAGGVCKPMNFTANTAAYSTEDLRNKSGLVLAGLQWTGNQLLSGKYLFGAAPQIGNDGVAVPDDVLNGTFSRTKTISTSGWELNSQSSADLALITAQTLQTGTTIAPVTVNPYLAITPLADGSSTTTVQTKVATLTGRLTPTRTYMLSFRLRYLQAPDAAATDTAISAGIATNVATSITADKAWFGKVTPTTNSQRFVVGPLKLSDGDCSNDGDCATLAQGNIVGVNHKPFDPKEAIVYFSIAGSNRAGIALDDVSILPVLNVSDPKAATSGGIVGQPNGDAFIGRTCRAYPNSTALDCSYTDATGKRFDGWQGYCLESDPRNPNVCLNWYPIDILSGDRNIFGKVEAAGYSDKSPLYMCSKAKGNYSTSTFNTDYVAKGTCSNDGTVVCTSDSQCGGNTCNPTNPLYNKSFSYRRPMDTYYYNGGSLITGSLPTTTLKHGLVILGESGCGTSTEIRPSGRINASGKDKEIHKSEIARAALIMQWGESSSWTPGINQACYSTDCANLKAYSGPTPDGPAYMIFEPSVANGHCWDGNCQTQDLWVATWTAPAEGGSYANFITFDILFDDKGYVSGYDLNAGDSTCGGGFTASLIYYLREMCTEVVQVVDSSGKNAAWSGNVTSSGFAVPSYKYKLSQEDKPYGSIAPPEASFDKPDDWDGQSFLGGNQPLEVKQNTTTARAGSAYTCTGNCSGRQCFGLQATALKTATSYSCDTLTDIQKCVTAGGYCNGFGTAKVCVAGPKASATDPVACSSNNDCGSSGICDYAGSFCSAVGSSSTKKVGDACTTSTECGTGGVCTATSNASGGAFASNRSTPARNQQAEDRLKVLFATVYDAWQWVPVGASGSYVPTASLVSNWKNAYNVMTLCSGNKRDPNLASTDPVNAYCGITPSIHNIAVGTQSTGNVIIQSGELVQFRFNTIVDSQQLPLEQIAIDWDGDTQNDETIPWGFGPRSDITDPHSISHVYRFGSRAGTCYLLDAQGGSTGPYKDTTQVKGKEYCVARPQVQIRDNWGWCNGGRCLGDNAPYSYAFPSQQSSYWEPYQGNIIVVR